MQHAQHVACNTRPPAGGPPEHTASCASGVSVSRGRPREGALSPGNSRGSRDGAVVRRGRRPHERASGRLVDNSVETARPPGIAVALYRSSMDTDLPDAAELVPALEQAVDD